MLPVACFEPVQGTYAALSRSGDEVSICAVREGGEHWESSRVQAGSVWVGSVVRENYGLALEKSLDSFSFSLTQEGEDLLLEGKGEGIKISKWSIRLHRADADVMFRKTASLVKELERIAREKEKAEATCRAQSRTIDLMTKSKKDFEHEYLTAFHHTINYYKSLLQQRRNNAAEAPPPTPSPKQSSSQLFSDQEQDQEDSEEEEGSLYGKTFSLRDLEGDPISRNRHRKQLKRRRAEDEKEEENRESALSPPSKRFVEEEKRSLGTAAIREEEEEEEEDFI